MIYNKAARYRPTEAPQAPSHWRGFIKVILLNVAAGQGGGRAGRACDGRPRADARQPSLRARARRAAPRWRPHSPQPPPLGRPGHTPGPKGPGLLSGCQSAAASLARARQGCEQLYTPSAFSCKVAQIVMHQSTPHVRDARLPCCCCVVLQALSVEQVMRTCALCLHCPSYRGSCTIAYGVGGVSHKERDGQIRPRNLPPCTPLQARCRGG